MYITYVHMWRWHIYIYICFRTRMRAALATKRDTRVAIMNVPCTVFGLRVREIPFECPAPGAQMNFQYGAVDGDMCEENSPESGPVICGDELKFPNLNALAQIPASSLNLRAFLFYRLPVSIILDTLSCSCNLPKFDTLAKKILWQDPPRVVSWKIFAGNLLINLSDTHSKARSGVKLFTRFLSSLGQSRYNDLEIVRQWDLSPV